MTNPESAIGQRCTFRKTMTVAEQAMFTGISGNLGAQYVDASHARRAGAPGMVAFELAVAALATTGLAGLGGPKRRIASLELSFAGIVAVGASIQAEAEVVALEGDAMVCRLRCTHAESGRAVMEGTARLEVFGGEE